MAIIQRFFTALIGISTAGVLPYAEKKNKTLLYNGGIEAGKNWTNLSLTNFRQIKSVRQRLMQW